MNIKTLQGILPVLPTPFDEAGKIDAAAMRRVAQFCLDSGAQGLVFPGVASEFDHLSPEEQSELLGVVCQVARDRIPVVCGGGKGDPGDIAARIQRARDMGAVAAMVLIPRRFAGDGEGALRFILSVAKSAPGVDIILQNAPEPIGAGLDAPSLIRIVSACSAIRYIKEEALPSGPRITALRATAPEHLIGVIGGGGARYLIDELNRGAIGAMPAAELTDVHVRIWECHRDGDIAEARELYRRILPLLVIQTIYRMRLTKHVLKLRGVLDNARVRAPLPEFDSFDLAELLVQMDSLSSLFESPLAESPTR